ncbi:MAG: 50S ribosomal protein L17 [Patescibacteria group bacterium]
MRHNNHNRKLGRESGQRRALLRSLAVGLIEHGKITTTEAKAKELRPFVEKLVTLAKKSTLAGRRLLGARLGGQETAVKTLMDSLGPRYKERAGGYTRIFKLPPRAGSGRVESIIEFV